MIIGPSKVCYHRIGQHELLLQLIKTISKFEKGTRHWLYVFITKKTIVHLAKCVTTAHAHELFCTQAGCVNCSFSCLITLSNKCSNQAGDSQSHLRILL